MKKKKRITGKKGEMTTAELVGLIILILSFVVLLLFWLMANLGGETNAQICHNSVMLQTGVGKALSQPLNCKTDYVCISGGQSCNDFTASNTIKIANTDVAQMKQEAMRAIADQMANCWWEFGEGAVNYAGYLVATHAQNNIAICSIISFDSKIQQNIPEISYTDLYNYMQDTKYDQSQTYLQYLYGISSVSQFVPQDKIIVNVQSDKITTGQKYSVITGVSHDTGIISPKEVIFNVYLIPTE